jgi:hypothetical protein
LGMMSFALPVVCEGIVVMMNSYAVGGARVDRR